jgi:hypothetical protein
MERQGSTTCGPLYHEALRHYAKTREQELLFAAGFVHGAAEKLHLGAAGGAMFRPSGDVEPEVRDIVLHAAMHYGLLHCKLVTTRGVELWLLRKERLPYFETMALATKENSEAWHLFRGRLCGVPYAEIDYRFHERRGFGERCDGVER